MAEILGDFGMAKLHAAGEEAKIPALRDTAIATLVQQKSELTPQQVAARNALSAFRELHVLGQVHAHSVRAWMRLSHHSAGQPDYKPDTYRITHAPVSSLASLDPPGSLTQSKKSGR
jgi:hypothetical protein